jgi:putative alpha-1,2-mannosidase
VVTFDRPYAAIERPSPRRGEKAPRYVLDFDLKPGETLQVKVALSTVSVRGGETENLAAESPTGISRRCHGPRQSGV